MPFFAEIPAEGFETLTRKMKQHSVATNEKVIRQGDSGKRLYMIARGVVRISQRIDGEEVNLATLIAGDFFGEMALLHDGDRTATVTSISLCTFNILERDDLQHAMLDNPAIRKALEVADKQRHKH